VIPTVSGTLINQFKAARATAIRAMTPTEQVCKVPAQRSALWNPTRRQPVQRRPAAVSRSSLSVVFRGAAVHLPHRSDRLSSKHALTQPELPPGPMNRTLCPPSLVNCGIRTQQGERFESLRCFNGVASALGSPVDIPKAARLRSLCRRREQRDRLNARVLGQQRPSTLVAKPVHGVTLWGQKYSSIILSIIRY